MTSSANHILKTLAGIRKVGGNFTSQTRVGLTCNEAATCILFKHKAYVAVFFVVVGKCESVVKYDEAMHRRIAILQKRTNYQEQNTRSTEPPGCNTATNKHDRQSPPHYRTTVHLLQAEQMASLQARWEEKKLESEKEHGTSVHLELPDIRITHEFSFEAPAGKSNADRAMPMPRPVVRPPHSTAPFLVSTIDCTLGDSDRALFPWMVFLVDMIGYEYMCLLSSEYRSRCSSPGSIIMAM